MNSSMRKSVIALMVVISACSIAVAAPKKGTSTKKPAAATAAEKKTAVSAVLSAESIELCKSGTPEQVKAALDAGTLTVTQKDENAFTAIMLAAAKNPNPEVIKVLKDAGANPNYKTKNGQSAMTMAVRYSENPAVIDALVEAGANVNEKDGSMLEIALDMGRIDMFKALVKAGADINAKDSANNTLLMNAIFRGNKDAVVALIAAGANVNEMGGKISSGGVSYEACTLSYAFHSREINKDIIKALISAGARADANGFSRKPVLYDAIYCADKETIDMLIKAGATIDDDISRRAVTNPNIEVVKMLVDVSKVNERDANGNTMLMLAATNTNPAVIEMLLNAGADVNVRFNSDLQNIDDTWKGITPLFRAAMQNPNPAVIELLLKHGANINVRNKNGDTPLIAAARENTAEVVKVLLNNGANFKACNKDHMNAFDVAQKNKKLKNTDVFWELNDLKYNTRDNISIVF